MNGRLFSLVLLLGLGCATLPKDFPATPSSAIPQTESTTLGQAIKKDVAAHPGKSGFFLLNTGEEAFGARVALTEIAERTIDAQYYIWNGDRSGVILMNRLVKAAERGVRVRLLLDDMTSYGKDLGLAALNQHPNIEIRLFNPLGRRYASGFLRNLSLGLHLGRMTNRMHNKIFVTDNQTAILGGRNIGDEYFGIGKDSNFRDMDLLAAGGIVAEISHAFDEYWNSPWAVPYEVFKTKVPSEKNVEKKRAKLEKRFHQMEKEFPYALDFTRKSVLHLLEQGLSRFVWAEAQVVSDRPGKALADSGGGSEILKTLSRAGEGVQKSLLIISPYFIITDESVKTFEKMVQGGLSVQVLTNSLKSTDALPVVAVYRTFREDLVKGGVQLYELRPDAQSLEIYAKAPKSRLSLHAKAVVFDGETVFVGTFNIDPRSMHLNTEVGLMVHSSALAKVITEAVAVDTDRQNAYALRLTKKGDMEWVCEEKGKEKLYSGDPHAGPFRRFAAWFLALLPIRSQL